MNYERKLLNNVCVTIISKNIHNFIENNCKELENKIKDWGYCHYYIFQRECSEDNKSHWQMYLEFNKQVYLSQIKSRLLLIIRDVDIHLEARKGKQSEAISYCQKEYTRMLECKGHIWGIPKVNTRRAKVYKNSDSKTKPCRIIWVWGKTGSGKSTWTDYYLNTHKWKEKDVTFIGIQNMIKGEKILFSSNQKECKVLVLNEVDKNFPSHNNLINFIDRKEMLLTRQDQEIKNNFELIIVNSLYAPEVVFDYPVEKDKAMQILRRIYSLTGKVLEIRANKEQLKKTKTLKDNWKWQRWYKPIVIEHKKPKSLISMKAKIKI